MLSILLKLIKYEKAPHTHVRKMQTIPTNTQYRATEERIFPVWFGTKMNQTPHIAPNQSDIKWQKSEKYAPNDTAEWQSAEILLTPFAFMTIALACISFCDCTPTRPVTTCTVTPATNSRPTTVETLLAINW